jgi:peptidylprolyl isomerase
LAKKKRKGGPTPPKKKPQNNRNKVIAISMIGLLALAAVIYVFSSLRGPSSPGSGPVGSEVTTASGLKWVDEVIGTGKSPSQGNPVTVNYVGTLENGQKFDSSYDRKQPLTFPIGMHQVIQGWDEGVMTMKEGGKRKLIIPPDLAYGARGRPGIPPNSTLIFEIELLKAS